MIADLIDKYLRKTNTSSGTFKFNGQTLIPYDSSPLYEIGLDDNSEIIVN